MEKNTFEIIESLDISESQKTLLIEAIEWEIQLSFERGYDNGYDTCLTENNIVNNL